MLIAGGGGEGRGQYGVFSSTPRNMAEYLQKHGRARLFLFALLWARHWDSIPASDAFRRHVKASSNVWSYGARDSYAVVISVRVSPRRRPHAELGRLLPR
jgi:hypothetical protein